MLEVNQYAVAANLAADLYYHGHDLIRPRDFPEYDPGELEAAQAFLEKLDERGEYIVAVEPGAGVGTCEITGLQANRSWLITHRKVE